MGQRQIGLATGVLVFSAMMLPVGCSQLSQYDITINDRIVYEPASQLPLGGIADPSLEGCLRQTLMDAEISEPGSLEQLNCSNAGIESLEGLEQFDGIRSLKLSGNKIRNLLALERLKALRQLWLDNNNVVDPIPVLRMTSLRQLDLTNNPGLQCPSSDRIPSSMQLTLPDHCDAT
jgi:Leucine-rich repeat (LRR) protein